MGRTSRTGRMGGTVAGWRAHTRTMAAGGGRRRRASPVRGIVRREPGGGCARICGAVGPPPLPACPPPAPVMGRTIEWAGAGWAGAGPPDGQTPGPSFTERVTRHDPMGRRATTAASAAMASASPTRSSPPALPGPARPGRAGLAPGWRRGASPGGPRSMRSSSATLSCPPPRAPPAVTPTVTRPGQGRHGCQQRRTLGRPGTPPPPRAR
jgi:hypothetical protein